MLPFIAIRKVADLIPVCVDIINDSLLRREGDVQPLGMQGIFSSSSSARFRAFAAQQPHQVPRYGVSRGALLSILDLCMELAADTRFLPEIGEGSLLLEKAPPIINTRFFYYELPRHEGLGIAVSKVLPSVPDDYERQELGWYLFTFAMRFVALHEQGHYLSGHLPFYREQHLAEIDEEYEEEHIPTNIQGKSRLSKTAEEAEKVIHAEEQKLEEARHKRAMEIEADSFALRNAILLGVRDWSNNHQPKSLESFLATPVDWCLFQFLGAAIVGLLLSYVNQNQSLSLPAVLQSHPSPECRLFGMMKEIPYVRKRVAQWYGDMSETWEAKIPGVFMGLQIMGENLGEKTLQGLYSATQSFVLCQPSTARTEYEELVDLQAYYRPHHNKNRATVDTEIGGPILG